MVVGEDFVFVHNPKTGGSSIRQELLPYGTTDKQHSGLFPPRGYQSKAFRIVVVRNPFNRMVSGWAYSQWGKDNPQPFKEWVMDPSPWMIFTFDFKRVPQVCWTWGCNYILYFESLEKDFRNLTRHMGLDIVLNTHTNSSFRKKNWEEYYDEELIEVVKDRFAPDFKEFNYETCK